MRLCSVVYVRRVACGVWRMVGGIWCGVLRGVVWCVVRGAWYVMRVCVHALVCRYAIRK